MGREVRRVPPDWQHPRTDRNGREQYQPMYDRSFESAMRDWLDGWEKWKQGVRPTYAEAGDEYWDHEGAPPDPAYYRPDWPEEIRTHYMMYEDTSEGTPISPAFETPEELARWLADNGASAFASHTATYEQWLRVCLGGWAPSAVITPERGLQSGVAALGSIAQGDTDHA